MSDEIHSLKEAMITLTGSINGLSIKFDERSKNIDKDISTLQKDYESIKNDIWGTGDGSPGIKVKVQEHTLVLGILKALTAILATATGGLIIQILWNVIVHSKVQP